MKQITKRIVALIISVTALSTLTGCSVEQIPPAHKAKVLTTNGYSPDIMEPQNYWLWGKDRLVLIETSTKAMTEPMSVVMKDKLTLTFDVKFRARIGGSDATVNAMFNDISPSAVSNNILLVDLNAVYKTYGQMLVRNISRVVVSKYDTENVALNYERISSEIYEKMAEALKSTPIEMSDVVLGNIEYPAVITEAVNTAKSRDLAIKEAEAQARIDLKKKEAEKVLAQEQASIDLIKAESLRDQNKTIAAGLSDNLIKYRALEVQEKMAEKLGNAGSVVMVPYDAMSNPAVHMRTYANGAKTSTTTNTK